MKTENAGKHTQGKWWVEVNEEDRPPMMSPYRVTSKGTLSESHTAPICRMELRGEQSFYNAHRIVAAVNACEGISTEALESGVVKELVKELVEALRGMVDSGSEISFERARRAIAKAEGR